jgi:predicted nucleic acid-binding protein
MALFWQRVTARHRVLSQKPFPNQWRSSSKNRPLTSDPDDDMVMDLAINGGAEALVTGNTKHFANAGKLFGIPVLSPTELLEQIRSRKLDGD